MPGFIVLTVIGEDRPGLVEELAEAVAAHGGNWLESRMSHLAGTFAGILRVSVEPRRLEPLLQALSRLSGLRVVAEAGAGAAEPPSRPARLELVGTDQPGIVRDLSAALARHRVNVEELETTCTDAPMSGQALFKASARLRLPAGVALDDLRHDLEALAQDLMVDLSLEPISSE